MLTKFSRNFGVGDTLAKNFNNSGELKLFISSFIVSKVRQTSRYAQVLDSPHHRVHLSSSDSGKIAAITHLLGGNSTTFESHYYLL